MTTRKLNMKWTRKTATAGTSHACFGHLLAFTIALASIAVRPLGAATVDVFPGVGTPLQDAIDAAAPGDNLVLHAGTFTEAIVISKSLKLYAALGAQPVIDAGSSGGFAVDIDADDVSMKGSGSYGRANDNPITIKCGAAGGVRIHNRTRVRLKQVRAGTLGGCDVHTVPVGLDILGSTQLKLTRVDMFGAIACHVRQEAAGSKIVMKRMFCSGNTAGAVFEDIAPGAVPGGAGIKVIGGTFVGAEISSLDGMDLINADGILMKKNVMTPGGSLGLGLTLDAGSDNNLIVKNYTIDGATDAGSGNCWRDNQGPGLPTSCP